MRNFLITCTLVIFSIPNFSYAKKNLSTEKEKCLLLDKSNPSYQKSLEALASKPDFLKWQKKTAIKGNTAGFIEQNNFPEYRNGKCFWSISVYEMSDSNFTYWKTFNFKLNSKGDVK